MLARDIRRVAWNTFRC